MRITSNTFTSSFLDNVGRLTNRQYQLQNQASTGQRVTSPEDDPVAMQRVLVLKAQSGASAQYEKNIEQHQDINKANFASIKALKNVSDRAGEIAVLADGLKSDDEMKIYAAEIGTLIQRGVEAANAQFQGDYLLSGTRTDQPPFTIEYDASGGIQGVKYNGSQEVPSTEIAQDVTLSSRVLGSNTTGTGAPGLVQDSRTGADFFAHLVSLQQHLVAGDKKAIADTDRGNLAKDEDNIIYHLGLNGAVQARLDASLATAQNQTDSIDGQISNEISADLADTMVQLNQTQVAYQAALQGGAKIMNLSLLDYLR